MDDAEMIPEYWPHALAAAALVVAGLGLGLLVGHDLRLETERKAGKAKGTCLYALEVGYRYAARGDSAMAMLEAENAKAGRPEQTASAASP